MHLDLGDQQRLTLFGDGAADDFKDDPAGVFLALHEGVAAVDLFAFPGRFAQGQRLRFVQPVLLGFVAQVALDEAVDLGRLLPLRAA